MANTVRVVVAGGGVAGLAAARHLVELFAAREAAGKAEPRLDLHLVAQLAPHEGSEGSGLGGKAMSRSFEGRYDAAHDGMDRERFYGPMMPHRGAVPHGYHVVWGYPNLRRMLREEGEDDALGGLLRPPPVYDADGAVLIPGGASLIPSFQGLLDDPTPGGPGIGHMGLVDPEHPASATRAVTRDLLHLRDHGVASPFLRAFDWLFGAVSGDLDPFSFADLFYAHEVDLELRLTLILSSLVARRTDPERTTVTIDGRELPLTDVEYDVWASEMVAGWARPLVGGATGLADAAIDVLDLSWLLPRWLPGDLEDRISAGIRAWLTELVADAAAVGRLAEATWESVELPDKLLALLPDGVEASLRRYVHVYVETERIVREIPDALVRLAGGTYPVWRTLHFRFAPDATFASPRSFDAAQAVRSLQLVFLEPRASRMWSPEAGRIQGLWLRAWRKLLAEAEAARLVDLTVHEGRVDDVRATPEGVAVRWGRVLGHGFGHGDLDYPHVSSLRLDKPPARGPETLEADVFLPALPPALLGPLLVGMDDARDQLAPLASRGNETLELLVWLREPIHWSEDARAGLRAASITGLEGPFCLLADYRCGLWSPEALAAERPFAPDEPFEGSILESCGSMLDLFAARDGDDPFGWPPEVKARIAALLFDPAVVDEPHPDPWVHVDGASDWPRRVADGSWTRARAADPGALQDWIEASRWLVWGWLRQLAGIKALGEQACRQLGYYARLVDPRGLDRDAILAPPDSLRREVRYVVMRNANRRNRFVNPGVGDWPRRPVSGVPLDGAPRVFPAGDWTRNGCDVMCMEAATLSGMRAARGVHRLLTGEGVPPGAPKLIPVLPPAAWYAGTDPAERPGTPVGEEPG